MERVLALHRPQPVRNGRGLAVFLGVQVGEDRDRAPVVLLQIVKRKVRLLVELASGAARFGEAGKPAGGRDGDAPLLEHEGRHERVQRLPAGLLQLLVGARGRKNQRKLVTPEPGQQRVVRKARRQPAGDFLKQAITDTVAEDVVDRLEAVEVENPDRKGLVAGRRCRDLLLELLEETAPVGQPRQRILIRHLADGPVERLQLPMLCGKFDLLLDPLAKIGVGPLHHHHHAAHHQQHVERDRPEDLMLLKPEEDDRRDHDEHEYGRRHLLQRPQTGDHGDDGDPGKEGVLALCVGIAVAEEQQ